MNKPTTDITNLDMLEDISNSLYCKISALETMLSSLLEGTGSYNEAVNYGIHLFLLDIENHAKTLDIMINESNCKKQK